MRQGPRGLAVLRPSISILSGGTIIGPHSTPISDSNRRVATRTQMRRWKNHAGWAVLDLEQWPVLEIFQRVFVALTLYDSLTTVALSER